MRSHELRGATTEKPFLVLEFTRTREFVREFESEQRFETLEKATTAAEWLAANSPQYVAIAIEIRISVRSDDPISDALITAADVFGIKDPETTVREIDVEKIYGDPVVDIYRAYRRVEKAERDAEETEDATTHVVTVRSRLDGPPSVVRYTTTEKCSDVVNRLSAENPGAFVQVEERAAFEASEFGEAALRG